VTGAVGSDVENLLAMLGAEGAKLERSEGVVVLQCKQLRWALLQFDLIAGEGDLDAAQVIARTASSRLRREAATPCGGGVADAGV